MRKSVATRSASETKYVSFCSIHVVPYFLPCGRELHVLCQLGPFAEMHSFRMARIRFVGGTTMIKGRAISTLLKIQLRVSRCGYIWKRTLLCWTNHHFQYQIGKS